MATLVQLSKNNRISKKAYSWSTALFQNPQKRGRFIRQTVTTPRKPNSAIRKIGKVLLCNQKRITVKLAGSGYYPNKFATVLIRGKGYKDTPGVKYTVIRGKLECIPLLGKKNRRSIYGVKQEKKEGDSIIQKIYRLIENDLFEENAFKEYMKSEEWNMAPTEIEILSNESLK